VVKFSVAIRAASGSPGFDSQITQFLFCHFIWNGKPEQLSLDIKYFLSGFVAVSPRFKLIEILDFLGKKFSAQIFVLQSTLGRCRLTLRQSESDGRLSQPFFAWRGTLALSALLLISFGLNRVAGDLTPADYKGQWSSCSS
jgi:hypothetical protein